MFCELFNSDQNHFIRTSAAWPFFWLILLVDFLKCWQYPSNSSEAFKILFFHENNHFEEKKGKFWGLFNFDQNRCIWTLPAWKFFLVDFFKCWKYLSNSSETFKILFFHENTQFEAFFHENNQFEEKKASFADFSILTKITVSGPYQSWPCFWLIFFCLIFWNVENTLPILLKNSKCVFFHQNKSVRRKNSMFCGLFNFDLISLYPDLRRRGHFFWLIFWNSRKYPSNSSETFKMLFIHENKQYEEKKSKFWRPFNFDQNRCIWTLPAWPFF